MNHILIVSPDPEMGQMLKLRFELQAYEVTLTHDIGNITNLLSRPKIKAILVDLVSNEKEEHQALKQALRLTSKTKMTRIVLLPRGTKESQSQLQATWPAEAVIRKPFELEALVTLMNAINTPKKSSSNYTVPHRPS